MSRFSLAARYRPQSFDEVVGQNEIKKILSRASKEDKVAPAYLLSGTRGVGKTTIARIFAKVLNCKRAPASEPCNACEQCKHVVQGVHVDVVEIDGASNRGIDDARRLRELIAYAPMEGRYKVFIIDEAHMLTRESFNALLKTLEEPPTRSTFIFATTEAHKFPVTIVSRCQHFVFKPISEAELTRHLKRVLELEKHQYEDGAVELVARRASGSVRDAMSLLGQVLMLSDQSLTSEDVRQVLGLADQEWYANFLTACSGQDYAAIITLNRSLQEKGVDVGFFLRELGIFWRNIFLLKRLGESSASLLGLSLEEARRFLHLSENFSATYVHAAWQMTIENQRQILMSLEPPVALELLFLNLASLPKLISLERISKLAASSPRDPEPAKQEVPAKSLDVSVGRVEKTFFEEKKSPAPEKKNPSTNRAVLAPTWEGFLEICGKRFSDRLPHFFNKINGRLQGVTLEILPASFLQYQRLVDNETYKALQEAAFSYVGESSVVQIVKPEKVIKPEVALKKDLSSHPIVQELQKKFDAELLRCTPIEDTST